MNRLFLKNMLLQVMAFFVLLVDQNDIHAADSDIKMDHLGRVVACIQQEKPGYRLHRESEQKIAEKITRKWVPETILYIPNREQIRIEWVSQSTTTWLVNGFQSTKSRDYNLVPDTTLTITTTLSSAPGVTINAPAGMPVGDVSAVGAGDVSSSGAVVRKSGSRSLIRVSKSVGTPEDAMVRARDRAAKMAEMAENAYLKICPVLGDGRRLSLESTSNNSDGSSVDTQLATMDIGAILDAKSQSRIDRKTTAARLFGETSVEEDSFGDVVQNDVIQNDVIQNQDMQDSAIQNQVTQVVPQAGSSITVTRSFYVGSAYANALAKPTSNPQKLGHTNSQALIQASGSRALGQPSDSPLLTQTTALMKAARPEQAHPNRHASLYVPSYPGMSPMSRPTVHPSVYSQPQQPTSQTYPDHQYGVRSYLGQPYTDQPYANQPYTSEFYTNQPHSSYPHAAQSYVASSYAVQPAPVQFPSVQPTPVQFPSVQSNLFQTHLSQRSLFVLTNVDAEGYIASVFQNRPDIGSTYYIEKRTYDLFVRDLVQNKHTPTCKLMGVTSPKGAMLEVTWHFQPKPTIWHYKLTRIGA